MSLLFLLTAFSLYWIAMSLIALLVINMAFKKYSNFPKFDVPEHYKGVMRQDFGKWDQAAIKKGCFLRFPFKVPALFTFLFWLSFLSLLHIKLGLSAKLVEFWRRKGGYLICRILNHLEQNFDSREEITTPIAISNHASLMDGLYLGSNYRCFSFIAKAEVKNVFLFSAYLKYSQCIFVDRTATKGRSSIIQLIKNRVETFSKTTDDSVFPIFVFPEGTCSNGRAILQFKNGAFDNLTPITIFSLKYSSKEFHSAQDQVNPIFLIAITLCLNPHLLVQKKQVSPNQGETVDQYRQRCRSTLAQMSGFKTYECNYKDYVDYEKQKDAILAERKKGRSQ